MQGRSLLPLVKGERWTEQEYTISGEQDITGVIRTEEWKLIKNMNSDEEVELYNIQSDPEELTNLANENPTKLSELSEQLENIIEIYGSLSCNSNLDKQSLSGIKDGPRISVYVDEIYDFETNDWKDFFEGGNINPSEGPGWYVSDEEGNSCTEEENCILEGYQETNLVTINSYIEIDSINVNLNMINEELKIGILDEDEEKYYFNFNDGSISLFQVNQKPKQTTVRIEDEDYTFDRDTWYEVSIEIEDNQITLTINGDIIIEKTISSLGDDIKIKLETIDSTHIMIDDLSISGKKYLS
jgi:hypothetical protein